MLPLVATVNSIFSTWVDSLKRDVANKGFEIIFLVISTAWVGSPLIAIVLAALGKFSMPTDPLFYWCWLALSVLTVIQYTLFVGGMIKTRFLAAESFSNLTFVTTALYAVVLLGESITPPQIIAIGLALAGALLFFEWRSISKISSRDTRGLLMIVFSLFIAPLEWVIYKESTFHTATYSQFLTGRVVMDFAYYSALFFLLFVFWYKKSPWPNIAAFTRSSAATSFTIGSIAYNLLDSYLFFKLPVTLLTIISTSSIVMGYLIGSIKYKEAFKWRYALGAVLIACAVVLFVVAGGALG